MEIDLGALGANWRGYRALGAAEAGAAVKADAYGCGAAEAGPALEAAGCRTFFVAALAEAIALAPRLGAESAIYVLNGYGPRAGWPGDPRIRPVLNTADEAAAWAAAAPGRPAALQIETGMNRLGEAPEALAEALARPGLRPLAESATILMSHLAMAEAPDDPLTQGQRRAFEAGLERLRPALPRARASLAASAAPGLGPAFAYDLIRPGYGLYGGELGPDPQPVVRLSAPLIRVWEVPAGARSGYGGAWTAPRAARLATLPLGYADGVPRALGGRGEARIRGQTVPIIGRISMDLTVLDITALDPAPALGERAFLLDETLTVGAMAARSDTIGYEILTRLDAARRLERRVNPL